MGGTGLYFKALTEGLVNIPNIPIKIRKKVRSLHKKIGSKLFFLELLKIDPLSKKFINPSDTQRSIRAYEIKLFTQKSMYEWFKNTKSNYNQKDFYKIYIDFPRNELLDRIKLRAKDMVKKGAVTEVKRFIKLKVSKEMSASKAIGVSEIKEYINNKSKISEVIDKISIKTRQYAKRQSTWARSNMVSWLKLTPQDLNKFLKKIK